MQGVAPGKRWIGLEPAAAVIPLGAIMAKLCQLLASLDSLSTVIKGWITTLPC